MATNHVAKRCGFTVVEILVGLAIVSVVASVGYVTVNNVRENAKENKLQSDVTNLNTAVHSYLGNGGSIPAGADAREIATALIGRMKGKADSETAAKMMGVTGNFVDTRLDPKWEDFDAGSSELRAVWNPTSNRFVVTREGQIGIKQFDLTDEFAGGDEPAEDTTRVAKIEASDLSSGQPVWVWDYADHQPSAATKGSSPDSGTATYPTVAGPTKQQLLPPTFTPTANSELTLDNLDQTASLSNLFFTGTINNGNPASYSHLSRASTEAFTFTSLSTSPISAYVISDAPDSYINSDVRQTSYTLRQVSLNAPAITTGGPYTPFQLGVTPSIGSPSSASVSATMTWPSAIPTRFQSVSGIQLVLAGTTNLSSLSGVNQSTTSMTINTSSNWNFSGGSPQLTVAATVKPAAGNFVFRASGTTTATVSATKPTLAVTFAPVSGSVLNASETISISAADLSQFPAGYTIKYTTDGSLPSSSNGTTYSTPLTPPGSGALTLRAIALPPTAYTNWFTSSAATATYTVNSAGTGTPDGALVGNANVNGTFVGSLVFTNQLGNLPSNINFNSTARITQGNIYFPGLPTLNVNGNINTIVQGRQFTSEGVEILPNTDTARVVDLTGSTQPVYTVNLNSGAIIQGKIYRRVTPPVFPTVSPPSSPNNGNTYTLNSGNATINPAINASLNVNSGTATLLPGNYGNVNTGGTLVLGTVGASTPSIYNFQGLNLNSGARVIINGPVVITMNNSLNVNSVIMGNSAHPEYMQVNLYNGDMNMNSGAQVYGKILAPNNTVNLNGSFNGSVAAKSLTINGNGIAFTLPPVVSG